jgi:hypothetical protein
MGFSEDLNTGKRKISPMLNQTLADISVTSNDFCDTSLDSDEIPSFISSKKVKIEEE